MVSLDFSALVSICKPIRDRGSQKSGRPLRRSEAVPEIAGCRHLLEPEEAERFRKR
jgi:hypothetical protein